MVLDQVPLELLDVDTNPLHLDSFWIKNNTLVDPETSSLHEHHQTLVCVVQGHVFLVAQNIRKWILVTVRTLPVEILSLELRLEVSDVVDLERVLGVELLVAELTDQVVKYITNNTYNNYQLIN